MPMMIILIQQPGLSTWSSWDHQVSWIACYWRTVKQGMRLSQPVILSRTSALKFMEAEEHLCSNWICWWEIVLWGSVRWGTGPFGCGRMRIFRSEYMDFKNVMKVPSWVFGYEGALLSRSVLKLMPFVQWGFTPSKVFLRSVARDGSKGRKILCDRDSGEGRWIFIFK